jgi:3'(2'), 5'-bisphosphate nucleotidase
MVRRIAVDAGRITLDYFDDAGFACADAKDDGSPVTVADRKAEEFIIAGLRDIISGIPVVGEESVSAGHIPDLAGAEYFWLVDPLDGTREFVSGSGEYTVNIALIRNGTPMIGVVYAPVPGELYAGCGPGTAVRWLEDNDSEKSIAVRKPPATGLFVVASRSHGCGTEMDHFLSHYKISKIVKRGSSLKLCAVASGKADLYPRFGPTCEWDIAAGDAVLRAAGGVVSAENGAPFSYGNAGGKFLNPSFIARSAALLLPSEMDQDG